MTGVSCAGACVVSVFRSGIGTRFGGSSRRSLIQSVALRRLVGRFCGGSRLTKMGFGSKAVANDLLATVKLLNGRMTFLAEHRFGNPFANILQAPQCPQLL
jgi:hypothetical protein